MLSVMTTSIAAVVVALFCCITCSVESLVKKIQVPVNNQSSCSFGVDLNSVTEVYSLDLKTDDCERCKEESSCTSLDERKCDVEFRFKNDEFLKAEYKVCVEMPECPSSVMIKTVNDNGTAPLQPPICPSELGQPTKTCTEDGGIVLTFKNHDFCQVNSSATITVEKKRKEAISLRDKCSKGIRLIRSKSGMVMSHYGEMEQLDSPSFCNLTVAHFISLMDDVARICFTFLSAHFPVGGAGLLVEPSALYGQREFNHTSKPNVGKEYCILILGFTEAELKIKPCKNSQKCEGNGYRHSFLLKYSFNVTKRNYNRNPDYPKSSYPGEKEDVDADEDDSDGLVTKIIIVAVLTFLFILFIIYYMCIKGKGSLTKRYSREGDNTSNRKGGNSAQMRPFYNRDPLASQTPLVSYNATQSAAMDTPLNTTADTSVNQLVEPSAADTTVEVAIACPRSNSRSDKLTVEEPEAGPSHASAPPLNDVTDLNDQSSSVLPPSQVPPPPVYSDLFPDKK
ncbi:uncharacterized protein LOC101853998 [Aplysia californica]|uniref:Uncharacterized protein LOC101853998 n=1 Tax=Aplysia californica TaxID=6500 RepID=A0ABM0JEN0_APLCA|nr:uncharacterized protein LOC101853998 [Aplysia californica]